MKQIIAKLKFWFGNDIKNLFNEKDYIIEFDEDRLYVYVYNKG